MAIKTVQFRIEVPDDVPAKDLQEWLEFELHARGDLKADNALSYQDLSALSFSVTVD